MEKRKNVMKKNTMVEICKGMTLELKEVKGTFTSYTRKEGYEEVESNTQTVFHWKLSGIASKLNPEVIGSEKFDPKEQEVYDVIFKSQGYDWGCSHGFKSREDAIRNALAFATQNGIEVDGYKKL